MSSSLPAPYVSPRPARREDFFFSSPRCSLFNLPETCGQPGWNVQSLKPNRAVVATQSLYSMKANRPVDFSGQSRKSFCIIQTIYFNQKKPFGILKKRFDVLQHWIRAFKVNDETFFKEKHIPLKRGGRNEEQMTFLKENAKNCVKSLLFCRFVRVITRFDKEKEVFRPKFAIVNERKTSCRKLE